MEFHPGVDNTSVSINALPVCVPVHVYKDINVNLDKNRIRGSIYFANM